MTFYCKFEDWSFLQADSRASVKMYHATTTLQQKNHEPSAKNKAKTHKLSLENHNKYSAVLYKNTANMRFFVFSYIVLVCIFVNWLWMGIEPETSVQIPACTAQTINIDTDSFSMRHRVYVCE